MAVSRSTENSIRDLDLQVADLLQICGEFPAKTALDRDI
jgi:hypothetical protein